MDRKDILRKLLVWLVVVAINTQSFSMPPQTVLPSDSAAVSSLVASPGQSLTVLPNGAFLLLGGVGKNGSVTSTATYGNPRTGAITALPHGLNVARSFHSASVLPDGTVFIFGGIG